MPSVAPLAAGLGVVVALWHGHHAQHIPGPCKDCSTVVGSSGDCWVVGCFLFPTTRDDLLHTTIHLNIRL